MAKLSGISLISALMLILFQGSIAISVSESRYSAKEYFHRQSICQFERLEVLEPDNRIEAEAGLTETWSPNHKEFQCAGVAFLRRTMQPNALHLPSYTNYPQLVYILRGKGILGTIFPGCAETFEEPQQGQSTTFKAREDRHQKLRHFREGDVIALPAGVSYWSYNNGNEPLVFVALLDTSNVHNQLDQFPRRFYLAGNPQEEFKQQYPRQPQGEYLYPRDPSFRDPQKLENKRNIFRGFKSIFLEEALKVDPETIRRLQGLDDYRNDIIRVKGKLDLVSPVMRSSKEYQREERHELDMERERDREISRRGSPYAPFVNENENGLEETFCSMNLRENIGDPSKSDIFNPQAGRISTVNRFNLPILSFLRLSASRGTLYKNGLYTPHWNQNAHSIMYVIRGSGRIQVVDHFGQTFFDGEVHRGQVLVIPQNHAVVKQASDEGFEWISFKTNDNAQINPIAGRTSVIRALPEAVLVNAFQISRDQAQRLKYNRDETFLLASTSKSPSEWRADA